MLAESAYPPKSPKIHRCMCLHKQVSKPMIKVTQAPTEPILVQKKFSILGTEQTALDASPNPTEMTKMRELPTLSRSDYSVGF
jgi:ubiquitin C-terminal hydrolase